MPVLRMTTRTLMFLVAFVAVLIGGAFEGMRLAMALKEEVRVRRAVVDHIREVLAQDQSWIGSLEKRIARSETQPTPDPRHDYWKTDLAYRQAQVARFARLEPKYQRLAYRPWIAFPDPKEVYY